MYDESEMIDVDTTPLDGGIMLKTLSFSLDPYLRHLMIEPHVRKLEQTLVSLSSLPSFPLALTLLFSHLWYQETCKPSMLNDID